jgi:hypothetical protein
VRSGFARRGRRADGAGVGRIYGSVMIGCALAAAACNKYTTRRGSAEEHLTRRGGAVMPHALINCKTDVRAEAESLATNLSASALSTRVRSEQ